MKFGYHFALVKPALVTVAKVPAVRPLVRIPYVNVRNPARPGYSAVTN
jgi:hypothetical protein